MICIKKIIIIKKKSSPTIHMHYPKTILTWQIKVASKRALTAYGVEKNVTSIDTWIQVRLRHIWPYILRQRQKIKGNRHVFPWPWSFHVYIQALFCRVFEIYILSPLQLLNICVISYRFLVHISYTLHKCMISNRVFVHILYF